MPESRDEEERHAGSIAAARDGAIPAEWFQKLFEEAAIGLEQIGIDGRLLAANRAICRTLGYRHEELIGRDTLELTHPDDVAGERALIARLLAGEIPSYRYEKRKLRKSGEPVWVRVTSSLARENGEALYRIAVVEDISEAVAAREALTARTAELVGVLDVAPAAIWLARGDGLRDAWGNRLAVELSGMAPDARGTIPAPGSGPRRTRRVFQDGRELEPGEYPLQRAARGETCREEILEVRFDDGTTRWLASSASPLRDGTGAVTGAVCVAIEVTNRHLADMALKVRTGRLRSILDTAPDAIILINERGTVESFSRSAEILFGYRADEIVGRNVKVLMPSPYREEHDGYLERYRRTGEKRIIGIGRVASARRKDGSVFPIELSVGDVEVDGQRLFTGFIRDLTARRRMEQELRQAQKMEAVGQLTGGLAHDFNNLLTVILGSLEMLEMRLRDPGQLELVHEAREATEIGAQLTERLLAFGRRQQLRPQLVDPTRLLKELAPLLRRSVGETIEVETRVEPDVWRSVVDPGQLQNALLNLAINARDAMPNGGKLTISAENVEIDPDYARINPEVRPGRYVVLAVTDTGCGMSRAVQERAFEPFFTTKEVGAGSGLGLSMVYGFVKQSNGHAQIYSEVGHGTTVRMYLPRAGVAADEPERPPSPLEAYRARGEAVLVVEDQPRVRRLTTARLAELGYDVLEAAHGPAALEILETHPEIDLLFTDVVMPGGMTGGDLALRARELRPDLPIVFTSGYAEPDVVGRSLTEGGVWLRKPYSAADLGRVLREVLEQGELGR